MNGYVVDASVAVKWVVNEPYSDQAAALLAGNRVLCAPEMIYAETANALWAMARRGDFGRDSLRDALDLLLEAPIAIPATMRQLAPAAARLALDLDHPAYDCFYLALALQEQRPMVTADRRFYAKVSGHAYLSSSALHVSEVRV
ncbi:MAG: type II toxin-antitoxin system VapC family toxin [Proteobacteria bacterium]|nr:type II toxin-antitoxin system VapC family toxin [Pseudomonadota bacterium]